MNSSSVIASGEITVVLNVYRRPHMLERQLRALFSQTVPVSKVIVWQNSFKDVPPVESQDSRVTILRATDNHKYHGRFAGALLARTEFVAVFDDDVIPGDRWLENCLTTFARKPGILGGAGIVLTSDSYVSHQKIGWFAPSRRVREVDLVGHAWFFQRNWLKYFWYDEPLSWDTGEDIAFSFFAKKYGGIRTYVPPHPPETLNLWSNTEGAAPGSDEVASWKAFPQHYELRDECVRLARSKGWKTVYRTLVGRIGYYSFRHECGVYTAYFFKQWALEKAQSLLRALRPTDTPPSR